MAVRSKKALVPRSAQPKWTESLASQIRVLPDLDGLRFITHFIEGTEVPDNHDDIISALDDRLAKENEDTRAFWEPPISRLKGALLEDKRKVEARGRRRTVTMTAGQLKYKDEFLCYGVHCIAQKIVGMDHIFIIAGVLEGKYKGLAWPLAPFLTVQKFV